VADLASAAVESGRSIGRYFSVVSMVPSLLFVLYFAGLVAAGAWSGPFEPGEALHAAAQLSVEGVAALLLVALLLGLALHPFQFSLTQLLEGYWGGSAVALDLAGRRIRHYRHLAYTLEDIADAAETRWVDAVETDRTTPGQLGLEHAEVRRHRNRDHLDTEAGDPMIGDYLRAEAARAARGRYPGEGRRTLPTRLGNALRRYEDEAGQQYGLDILRIAPHLNLVAAKEHREYVDDTRKGLDLSVRLCVLFSLAAVVSVGLLADDGAWLMLALAPYCISYLAYRGAVASAHSYGTALSTLVDLDRFALYERLRMVPPPDTLVERERNAQLLKLLSHEPAYLLYAPPPPPATA
jgi:hypothetical protein